MLWGLKNIWVRTGVTAVREAGQLHTLHQCFSNFSTRVPQWGSHGEGVPAVGVTFCLFMAFLCDNQKIFQKKSKKIGENSDNFAKN